VRLLLELIFFMALSAYIFYRLWSVLGEETDEDRDRRDAKRRQLEEKIESIVVTLPPSSVKGQSCDVDEEHLKSGVREGLRLLQEQEPNFDFSTFLKGAKGAYELVLEAFAKGDFEALKVLVSEKVYQAFASEIDDRTQRGETYSVVIEHFDRVDVDAIEIHGNEAAISVRFRTHQVLTTRDTTGEIIDNKAQVSIPVTEIWTFTRPIGAKEPNWYLSQTHEA
jgi:predicted lipid-binding transport protein (Tim44 family)